ncbi:hypothetical protein [Saccharopolyspora sp. NPDC049426]|uniref:hypothetical protein n=1 Tax=Saccharopolyspora sp. NPDC049426 TaxID=3155652 RepID=UPI00341C0348
MRVELVKRLVGDVDRIAIGADVASWISGCGPITPPPNRFATRMPKNVHAL